jgi:hypothetical protein
MPTTNIHLLAFNPLGLLIVFYEQLWKFQVLSSDGAIYGYSKSDYTSQGAEEADREWVGSGW